MKKIRDIGMAILLLCIGNNAIAQRMKVQDNLPAETEIPTGVIVHSDPRLAILERKHRNIQLGVIRSGRGYRVQIYNGNDRNKANQIKVDFMRRFPGVRTYLTYVQPQFRVKVGDYRGRDEAQQMYNQVSGFYNPSMIVPDIIVINTLKDD
ncbi:MAG: SPOR domain-containing protein [Sphingobacteriales bacterium]|nr:MAG: SPOR domain-containing protein [Sphingobacteriales bacterium]